MIGLNTNLIEIYIMHKWLILKYVEDLIVISTAWSDCYDHKEMMNPNYGYITTKTAKGIPSNISIWIIGMRA